nr:GPR endopeptidase [bacterium]
MLRTDLAMEAAEGQSMPGVIVSTITLGPLTQTDVRITSREGAQHVGKPMGNYITQQWESNLYLDTEQRDQAAAICAKSLRQLLGEGKKHILVVGLGNRHITPDALGPRVVEKILVTRHITTTHPEWLDQRFITISAIAPGVMGETGVETAEVIRAVVQKVRPDAVVCVDALASRRTQRVACTLQMSDTGIQPGGGLGNPRAKLNQATLKIPVIAIGVPMVVFAGTIARDAAEALIETLPEDSRQLWHGGLPDAVEETAQSAFGDMVVTPKDVDHLIEEASTLVADCMNLAFHRDVDLGVLRGMRV